MKERRTLSLAGAALSFAAAGFAAWLLQHLRAPAVRAWRPGRGEITRAGKLSVRIAGRGERAFVLLHGLVASGDTFGSGFDRLTEYGQLVDPDLLGFGRSMDAERRDFALVDHLDALDCMVKELGLADRRLVIGGHSLGGLLALHWAARRRAQVDAVVTWGATLFRDEEEARGRLKAMGPLEQLFAQDSTLAEKSCQLMCNYRNAAAGLAVVLSPDLPVTISRQAVLHTWPAYRGAVSIFFSDWQAALSSLNEADVPVTIVAGTDDPSQTPGLTDQLVRRFPNTRAVEVPGAAHILPLTHPAACAGHLLQRSRSDLNDRDRALRTSPARSDRRQL